MNNNNHNYEDDISLRGMFWVLRKRIVLVIATTLGVTIAGLLIRSISNTSNLSLSLAISFVLGVMLSVFLVFFLEFMDDSIKTKKDVMEKLGLTVIGTIPYIQKDKQVSNIYKLNANSFESQSYQMLATNIVLSKKTLKVITITSPSPSEGTTTATVNLAAALANRGNKVVVLDCNLKKPMVHKQLDVANEDGMVDLIQAKGEQSNYIKTAGLKNLEVITAGSCEVNPVSLLDSNHMETVISGLRETYDYILIDTPPAGVLTDSIIMSSVSDGVIINCASESSDIEVAQRVKESLEMVGANIIGVVLNKIKKHNPEKYHMLSNVDYYTK